MCGESMRNINIGGHYKIYEKEYSDHCDYVRCTLSTPYFSKGMLRDWCHEENHTVRLEADTKISFTYSSCHWCFMLYVLGFGICLQRQWDY